MRKTRLLTLLLLLITAVTGAVAQGPWTSGDCTVTLSGDVLTVSGTGAMANYADSYDLPWDGYRYDIKTIVIENGVTSIGNSAFAKCYNLESVSIPASVTSIGSFAFEDCGSDVEALTVSFAEGSTPLTISEYAFNYSKLKSIDIPKRMTSIGNCAFSGCSFLESVSIPASVTIIGDFAFQRCGEYAEALTVSFAEGSTLESIGEYAFIESALKSIDIPNSVTSIGERAFSGCSKLESVSIPASVTSIGVAAFSPCYMLAKVNIYASSLTTYGADAFKNNAAGRKIYVLPTAVDTYKAGWPDYADDIEAMTVYATSVKEGTEDAENWSATPSQAEEGYKVTINYAGTKSVKSVTAKRKITTGNIMVYFTDAQNYGDVNVYYWNDGGEWPGTAMTYVETNEYSQKIYRAEIPATAVGIIFNGNGNQTVDITENIADGSWWYTTDELEGANNKVGYVGKYTENIVVTNVDDNKWTFTQPDGNVELDIEYYPAYPVTISDGDKDAANWSATPTEQSVGQNVTLQYTGRKKIKRITIEAAPAYTLLSAATTEDIGMVVCAAGHLHDAKTAVPDGCTAVGILGKVTETGHGLILALQDATSQNWNTINGWTSVTTYAGTTLKVLPNDAARGTNLTSYTALGSTAVSNWAVAQKSDYEAIFTNLGSTTGNSDGTTYDGNVNAYITTGVGGTAISGDRWSATEVDGTYAWRFHGNSWRNSTYKTSVYSFRPVLGF